MTAAVPDSPDRALVREMAETMARAGGPHEWDPETLAAWIAYYERYARALLDGPLAPLLAERAEALAALERVEALARHLAKSDYRLGMQVLTATGADADGARAALSRPEQDGS